MIRLLILTTMAILMFAAFLDPTYAIQLQYNLKENATYKWVNKISTKGSVIIDKAAVDFKINGSSTQTISVLSIEANGDLTLMNDFTIDSLVFSVAGESERMASKSFKFKAKLTKSGKMLEVKNLSERPAGIEYYNPLGTFTTFFQFPERDIQVGEEWNISISERENQILPAGSKVTSKLIGFEEIEGHDCAKIITSAIMPLSLIPEIQMPNLKSKGAKGAKDAKDMGLEGSQQVKFEYTSYFATDLGVLLKGNGRISVKAEYLTKSKSVGSAEMVGDVSDLLMDIQADGKSLISFQDPALEQIVSLNLNNEDLGKVIVMLFRQYGANIVVDRDVNIAAKVTTQLEKVPLKYALDQILESQGYGYKKIEGGIIRIITLEKLRAEGQVIQEEVVETKIFPLKNLDPTALLPLISQFTSDKGKVVAESEMKLIAVTDIAGNLEKIAKLISQLDRKIETEAKEQKEQKEQKLEAQGAETLVKTEKRLLKLKYADPDRVRALLAPLLGKNGKVYTIEAGSQGSGTSEEKYKEK